LIRDQGWINVGVYGRNAESWVSAAGDRGAVAPLDFHAWHKYGK